MPAKTISHEAKITSKGQVTIPVEIRRFLGVKEGDKVTFESKGGRVQVSAELKPDRFAKYAGIGNPGLPTGRRAILRYIRELRGR